MSNLNQLMQDFAQDSELKELPPPPPPLVAPAVAPNAQSAQAEPEPTEREPATEEELDSNTESVLQIVDAVQKKGFTVLLEKKKEKRMVSLYGSEAKKLLENALAKQDRAAANLTENDLGLIKIEEKSVDILAQFPLTPEEKDLLRPHILKIIKKNNDQIPDGFWAAFAVFGVFAGRFGNVMTF